MESKSFIKKSEIVKVNDCVTEKKTKRKKLNLAEIILNNNVFFCDFCDKEKKFISEFFNFIRSVNKLFFFCDLNKKSRLNVHNEFSRNKFVYNFNSWSCFWREDFLLKLNNLVEEIYKKNKEKYYLFFDIYMFLTRIQICVTYNVNLLDLFIDNENFDCVLDDRLAI